MSKPSTQFIAIALAGLFVAQAYQLANAAENEKPNFLIFLADDCSYHDFGCYGNDQIITPIVDSFSTQGLQFEYSFNSAPMCAPTRMSLYTGIHPVRNGAHPNHSRVYKKIKSMPHYLGPLGYQVALIGKQHYAPKENFPFEFLGGKAIVDGQKTALDLTKIDAYIRDHKSDPFCLVVCSNQPHKPWDLGDPSAYDIDQMKLPPNLVDTPETRREMAKYYAEITYMDHQFGSCLESLKRHEVDENTIVVFLSEQGSNFPMCKWTCYEAGLRSAQIVRWPNKIAAGSKTGAMVQYIDLLPTMIEIAGGDSSQHDFDGKSYRNVLLEGAQQHRDKVYGIQTSRGIHSGPEAFGVRCVRNQQYRLVWNVNHENAFQNLVTEQMEAYASWKVAAANGDQHAKRQHERYRLRPEFEFYDLKKDPFELNDLSASDIHQALIEELKSDLKQWMDQQGDLGAETERSANDRVGRKRQGKKNATPR